MCTDCDVSDDAVGQLPMFLDPADIIERVSDGTWGSVDYVDDGYAHKLAEGEASNLCDSIAREGVQQPVVLWLQPHERVTTGNGHHRTACAAALGQLVPVIWSDHGYMGFTFTGYTDHGWTGPDGRIRTDARSSGGWWSDTDSSDPTSDPDYWG